VIENYFSQGIRTQKKFKNKPLTILLLFVGTNGNSIARNQEEPK
jgi:hypothetical protein